MLSAMLGFLTRPLRSVLDLVEREADAPLLGAEHEVEGAVVAIHRAAASIERHVEVIEELATSVGPLTESVSELTSALNDLLTLLAPVEKTEQELARLRGFLGLHRRPRQPASGEPGPTEPQ